MGWESAEKVQKNAAGEYRAMIGGEWVPVAKAQKSPAGEFRVMRNAPAEVGAGATPKEGGILDAIKQGAGNLAAGAVRGAGSIGSTILAPADMLNDAILDPLPGGQTRNQQRRAQIDEGLQAMGAEPDSGLYATGKIAGEIAGTAGAGGVMANGMRAVPALAKFAPVVESGGFGLGNAATGSTVANTALRAAGGAIQGGAQAGMVDPSQAGMGAAIGAGAPMAIKAAGAAGSKIGGWSDAMARRLMQSAMKPTLQQMKTGQADRAITTMLNEGVNATKSGVEKMYDRVDDLSRQVAEQIKNSGATVSRDKVLSVLGGTKDDFLNQVNPAGDLAAIDDVAGQFSAHPYFKSIEAKGPALRETLATAEKGKGQALQAAGKLKTFAAQQNNLAEGAALPLMKSQPENQFYFNTGGKSGQAISPSAYPVQGMPRVPPRYTRNIDRISEGEQGYNDAMAAYLARRADEDVARQALSGWEATRGQLPVQQAQALKQGTYQVLRKKYGEAGSAATEAQKALARGLKEQVAEAVPAVAPLNARESALIEALDIAERRAMMDANKNPAGLGLIAPNAAAMAAFLADRSAGLKSLAARGLHGAANPPIPQALPNLMEQYGLLGAPSVMATSP